MAYITILGFSKMKPQTIFNKAVQHIGKTKCQSHERGRCVYGGTGCNAAPFIREDQRDMADKVGSNDYYPEAVNSGWGDLSRVGLVPKTHADFMQALQRAHDHVKATQGTRFMQAYDERMRIVAETFGLNTKALDKLGWKEAK